MSDAQKWAADDAIAETKAECVRLCDEYPAIADLCAKPTQVAYELGEAIKAVEIRPDWKPSFRVPSGTLIHAIWAGVVLEFTNSGAHDCQEVRIWRVEPRTCPDGYFEAVGIDRNGDSTHGTVSVRHNPPPGPKPLDRRTMDALEDMDR